MSQDNRKKPEVRSGDDIHPALATAIKIGGLVVMVALAIVIVFILIEVFKKDPEEVVIFEDNHHLVLEDFEILTNPDVSGGIFEDISNDDIKNILINLEENDFYVYFYYSSQKDQLTEAEIEAIEALDEDYPLFIVDLDDETFVEWLELSKWQEVFITNEDIEIILNKDKTNSFILQLDLEGRLEETELNIYYGNNLLVTFE